MKSYYLHPLGICESAKVGINTKIWAFTHILKEARIGRNCNICDHVFIENKVEIGDNVTIKSGVQLWDGIRVGNNVFIGPNATFTNDPFPKSKKHLTLYPVTIIEEGASIGANATLLPGVTIGMHSMVGAGAVVTHNVPPYAVVVGNPSRIVRYINTNENLSVYPASPGKDDRRVIRGVEMIQLPKFKDMRGKIFVTEIKQHFSFPVKRIFWICNVPSQYVRGEHAHKKCHQALICVNGSCKVNVDNGYERQEITLKSPEICLSISPGIWASQYAFSKDAVLMVLASHTYNAHDYIRDYGSFRRHNKL
jgi:UDP-2-acetamido-3-amino-2,3-dideoxy-glucuronate N-acetyltransferase